VNNGATLSGAATIAGAVTINTGGILSPGNPVGALTVGALTLSPGSILSFEFNASPSNDRVTVSNLDGLTINGGSFNFYSEGTTNPWATLGTYNLYSFSGTIQGTGLSAFSVLNPAPGFDYTFVTSANFVTLTVASSGLITNRSASGGGSWGNNANWTNTAPNQIGATANFGNAITAPSTVRHHLRQRE
jgi:hypothetical protein